MATLKLYVAYVNLPTTQSILTLRLDILLNTKSISDVPLQW